MTKLKQILNFLWNSIPSITYENQNRNAVINWSSLASTSPPLQSTHSFVWEKMEGIFPGIFPHLFCLLFLLMFRLVTHAAAVEQTTTVILGGNEFIFKELDLSRKFTKCMWKILNEINYSFSHKSHKTPLIARIAISKHTARAIQSLTHRKIMCCCLEARMQRIRFSGSVESSTRATTNPTFLSRWVTFAIKGLDTVA